MTVINKNDERTVYTRESSKGKKHLVVRVKKTQLSPGEKWEKDMKKAARKWDKDTKKAANHFKFL